MDLLKNNPAINDRKNSGKGMIHMKKIEITEGNSPAHYLACITRPSVQIIVEGGHLALGRWQGVFFCEFDGPRHRKVWVKVMEG